MRTNTDFTADFQDALAGQAGTQRCETWELQDGILVASLDFLFDSLELADHNDPLTLLIMAEEENDL